MLFHIRIPVLPAILLCICFPLLSDAETAQGIVFDDANNNGALDRGEQGIPGVSVSNSVDVTLTDGGGAYSLPVDEDTALFVIKPSGWRTARDPETRLARFYYLHKPGGSPELKYPGVAPTGPLPASVDFPLYRQEEKPDFTFIAMGDTQASNMQEVEYLVHDVFEELIGSDAAFGITLGDLSFNTPALFEPLSSAIAVTGLPWYHVIGNHDTNYQALDDMHSDESWERVFGPACYAFNYADAHFIVLDDICWNGKTRDYNGRIGEEQLAFIENDLKHVPLDKLIIPVMHIPLQDLGDCRKLFALLEDRPHTLSISAHWHRHENYFFGKDADWDGDEPHHHLVCATACGNWRNGAFDEKGIPIAPMTDGAPNGYCFVDVKGNQYTVTFKGAGKARDYQMHVFAPERVKKGEAVKVIANVFDGSERNTVEMRVGDSGTWTAMKPAAGTDPFYQANYDRETAFRRAIAKAHDREAPWEDTWKKMGRLYRAYFRGLSDPNEVAHLWEGAFNADLSPGYHVIQVRTEDMYGRAWSDRRAILVTE